MKIQGTERADLKSECRDPGEQGAAAGSVGRAVGSVCRVAARMDVMR